LSFSFGNQKIEDLPIGVSTSDDGIQGNSKVSGIIGNQIMRLYNFSLDYENEMLYLVKDHAYEPQFSVNCSGIDLQLSRDKERMLIHEVIQNSPASEAGIQENDELISINGTDVNDIDMPDITKMLKRKGETVNLVVKSNGKERPVTLQLRSLIE
jgi:C-terminal processing protease CtpA/Prc